MDFEMDSENPGKQEMHVTFENMHRIVGLLRFQVESQINHTLPYEAIYATVENGSPTIIVAEKYQKYLLT